MLKIPTDTPQMGVSVDNLYWICSYYFVELVPARLKLLYETKVCFSLTASDLKVLHRHLITTFLPPTM